MASETTDDSVHRMWRSRLRFVWVVMLAIACVVTLINLAYPGSWEIPLLLWVGTGCIVLAWRATPRGVRVEERATMGRSALWTCLGIAAFFVGPVLLMRAGIGT